MTFGGTTVYKRGGFWWDCTVCTKTFHLIYFDAVFSLN